MYGFVWDMLPGNVFIRCVYVGVFLGIIGVLLVSFGIPFVGEIFLSDSFYGADIQQQLLQESGSLDSVPTVDNFSVSLIQ